MLTEEALRSALALVVNAISSLGITQEWGDGTTSSSDVQQKKLSKENIHNIFKDRQANRGRGERTVHRGNDMC